MQSLGALPHSYTGQLACSLTQQLRLFAVELPCSADTSTAGTPGGSVFPIETHRLLTPAMQSPISFASAATPVTAVECQPFLLSLSLSRVRIDRLRRRMLAPSACGARVAGNAQITGVYVFAFAQRSDYQHCHPWGDFLRRRWKTVIIWICSRRNTPGKPLTQSICDFACLVEPVADYTD
ncbi:hypothetical protein CPAR01_07265 [Colletotrichum paranaense]|uniref:Uncharacterized protein n=1 Tax=Colletotrichum paranaense TaxID=1914294 RepID=A0ABQ9SP39_9PEZI|nr:uncharacterized protein CPAR01_07265 [Colletotrichum paranaense]KAK1541276.1 hypothetical protein CPAR01_07265 [Colletotrichum paranaense]